MNSKEHTWHLDDPHFDNIKNGKKIYETRVYDKKRKEIKLGDTIIFTHRDNHDTPSYKTIVVEIKLFNDFKSAIKDCGIKKVLPNVNSLERGVKLYEKFPHGEGGTFKDAAEKYGVVRFKLAVNNEQKTHILSIQNLEECPTFNYIKDGTKTVEGRKNSLKYQKYNIGDLLEFVYNNEKVLTIINYINKYETIEDYLKKETLKRALPCVKTIKDGVEIYNLWVSNVEIEYLRIKYDIGFLGIGIHKI